MSKKTVVEGVVIGVLVGLLLLWISGLLNFLWGLIKPLLASIPTLAVAAWQFLTVPMAVPRWLALGALIVVVVSIFAGLRRHRLALTKLKELTWLDYTQDEFFGAVWRWEWTQVDGKFVVHHLSPFCLVDDTRLIGEIKTWAMPPSVHLKCETCNAVLNIPNCTADELPNKVLRQIERKIRHGEWQQIVARRSNSRTI